MRWARAALRANAGATALEFAILAPVFFLVTFFSIDLGLELATQLALDNAVAYAARQIEIGTIGSSSASSFTSDVCSKASALISSCTSNIQVYVTSGTSFSSLTPGTVNAMGKLSPTTFTPGVAGSDVLVQVAYTRSFLFGTMAQATGLTSATLLSTFVLRNEPYS